MFSRAIIGNVDECRTECEISDDTGTTVAVVYEDSSGWHIDLLRGFRTEEVAAFDICVETSKQKLSSYVNRRGSNLPKDATAGGLSLWLMQKDDGTTLGIGLGKSSALASSRGDVSPDLEERIRSIARRGNPLEAIRELRTATNCSLEQARAWLNDKR
jgi:hypothetical protein